MLANESWSNDITVGDAALLNSPCDTFEEAESRGAITCHWLAEYKELINSYLSSRSDASDVARTEGRVVSMPDGLAYALDADADVTTDAPLAAAADALVSGSASAEADAAAAAAAAARPQAEEGTINGLGPMLRVLQERVAPYLALRTNATSSVCHVGATDGSLAAQLAVRLRIPTALVISNDDPLENDDTDEEEEAAAAAKNAANEEAGSKSASYSANEAITLPLGSRSCDVVLLSYFLYHSSASHIVSSMLREARRIARDQGFVLLAERRAGQTKEEDERNTEHDPHGIFRPDSEWRGLLSTAGLELLATGPVMGSTATGVDENTVKWGDDLQVYYITRPSTNAPGTEQ